MEVLYGVTKSILAILWDLIKKHKVQQCLWGLLLLFVCRASYSYWVSSSTMSAD